MIAEFTKEKLLPLFQKYIEITANNPLDHYQYIVRRVPIECQIIATEPRFILSDGFHKVASEVSIDAVVRLKEQYPTIRFKELTKCIITILDYEPYTYLDEYGNIRLKLNVYNFVLNSPNQMKAVSVLGNPKKLSSTNEIKQKVNYETSKHLKSYLAVAEDLDNLPPLERILLNDISKESLNRAMDIKSVLQCPGNDPGDRTRLLDCKRLNELEDILTEEAGKQIRRQKDELKKQKEEGRHLAKLAKRQSKSLCKELVGWADKYKDKTEENKTNAVTEGLVELRTEKLKVPEDQKPSEVKYTAKGFKGFLKWASHNHDSEENNVEDVIAKDKIIKVDFTVPDKTKKVISGKRQNIPDKVISCCKTVYKKPKP